MLFAILGAAAVTMTLTICFTIFSVITDENKGKQNSVEGKEKGQENPLNRSTKERQVENMQGIPVNRNNAKNNLKSIPQPIQVTHKKDMQKTISR